MQYINCRGGWRKRALDRIYAARGKAVYERNADEDTYIIYVYLYIVDGDETTTSYNIILCNRRVRGLVSAQ